MKTRIKELRREKRMSQVRLSVELGVSQEAISAYESGRSSPSIANLLQLSKLFHVSCDYILGISDVRQIRSSTEIRDEDWALLEKYRSLDNSKRPLLLAFLEGLTAG